MLRRWVQKAGLTAIIAVTFVGVPYFVSNTYGMGEGEVVNAGAEKTSEKLRDRIRNKYGEDSRSARTYDKAHKVMFDTFGIKEHNRKVREQEERERQAKKTRWYRRKR